MSVACMISSGLQIGLCLCRYGEGVNGPERVQELQVRTAQGPHSISGCRAVHKVDKIAVGTRHPSVLP